MKSKWFLVDDRHRLQCVEERDLNSSLTTVHSTPKLIYLIMLLWIRIFHNDRFPQSITLVCYCNLVVVWCAVFILLFSVFPSLFILPSTCTSLICPFFSTYKILMRHWHGHQTDRTKKRKKNRQTERFSTKWNQMIRLIFKGIVSLFWNVILECVFFCVFEVFCLL